MNAAERFAVAAGGGAVITLQRCNITATSLTPSGFPARGAVVAVDTSRAALQNVGFSGSVGGADVVARSPETRIFTDGRPEVAGDGAGTVQALSEASGPFPNGDDERFVMLQACLLYTSPSPRD